VAGPLADGLSVPPTPFFGIDRVIRLVRSDEPNVDHAKIVSDPDNDAILVSGDVKHDPVVLQDARTSEMSLDLRRRLP
jgi:hypothetical protein